MSCFVYALPGYQMTKFFNLPNWESADDESNVAEMWLKWLFLSMIEEKTLWEK